MQFSAAFIEQLKASATLSEIAGKTIELTGKGRSRFQGLCPFHGDKNPSLIIDDNKGRWKCWSCQAKGDALDWISKTENLEFYGAVKQLAHYAGIPLPQAETTTDYRPVYRTLGLAQHIYTSGLKRNTSALEALQKRGINEDTIQKWGLGAVSSGILPHLRATENQLLDSGIAGLNDNGRLYERLRQRITIPLLLESGMLVGFAGRRIHDWDNSPKYLNPPETVLFKKSEMLFGASHARAAIRESSHAFIVEGYFDVIALHQAGENRAVAGMGTAITQQQIARLMRMTRNITMTFCFDGDTGGQKAVTSLLPRLLAEITDHCTVNFMFLPANSDPDSFIRNEGLTAWRELSNSVTSLADLLLRYATRNFSSSTVEEMQQAAIRAEAICKSIKKAPYLRQLLINAFRQQYGLTLEVSK